MAALISVRAGWLGRKAVDDGQLRNVGDSVVGVAGYMNEADAGGYLDEPPRNRMAGVSLPYI